MITSSLSLLALMPRGKELIVLELEHYLWQQKIFVKSFSSMQWTDVHHKLKNFSGKLITNFPITFPCVTNKAEIELFVKMIADEESFLKLQHEKEYERKRLKEKQFTIFEKMTMPFGPPYSRTVLNKIKKGIDPISDRIEDIVVFVHFGELFLKYLKWPLPSLSYFSYPLILKWQDLFSILSPENVFESWPDFFLANLYLARKISFSELKDLEDIEKGVLVRMKVIKMLEEMFSLFLYQSDYQKMLTHVYYFKLFLLGLMLLLKEKNVINSPFKGLRYNQNFLFKGSFL